MSTCTSPCPVLPEPTALVALCIACDAERAAPGAMLGPSCRRRLVAALDAIADGFGRLDPQPGRGARPEGPAPIGFVSKPPLSVPVLSLIGSGRERPVAPLGGDGAQLYATNGTAPDTPRARASARPDASADPVLVTVGRVADRAREAGILPGLGGQARTVSGELFCLRAQLDAIGSAWWVGEALVELERCARAIRRALGEDEVTLPLGRCPRRRALGTTADGAAITSPCGGQVRARPHRWSARCGRCGHRWSGERTIRALAEQVGEAWLDLAALRAYLGSLVEGEPPSPERLRKWAQRDGWARERRGRRTLYRLADALRSARRAWDREHPVLGPELPPDWYAAAGVEGPVELPAHRAALVGAW